MGDGTRRNVNYRTYRMTWLVRIRAEGTDRILGTGVLLGGRTVLTCAHVLPDEHAPVTVDFLEIEGAPSARARVIDGCWKPELPGDRADVALLEVDTPQSPEHSAPLVGVATPPGELVDLCGYPEQRPRGAAFRATVSRQFGERTQLNPEQASHAARRGFSGGPVLPMDSTSSVLGLTVSRWRDHQDSKRLDLTYMIPIETVIRHLPRVARWTTGDPGVDPPLASRVYTPVPDTGHAERLADWFRGESAPAVYLTVVEQGSQREATLQRAITLADRVLSAGQARAAAQDPPSTIPPVGSLDLAMDVTGRTLGEVAERVAKRMNIALPDPELAIERLRERPVRLTVVVVGVDRAAAPAELVEFLALLAERGCRLLLVFRDAGSPALRTARAQIPVRHRMARLGERLDELARRESELGELALRFTGVPEPVNEATKLREHLAELRHVHRTDPDVPLARLDATLAAAEREAETALLRTGTALEEGPSLLARRKELRDELESGRLLSLPHGRVEDVDLAPYYRSAYEALHVAPCDLDHAEQAVARYVGELRRALGWPGTEEPA